jgi:D-3-phosphoglycerate dehydrogenase / 2-oxoglutarate reductase
MDAVLMALFVAVTDSPAGNDLSIERSVLTGMRVEKISWNDRDSLVEAVREADGILCMHAHFDEHVIRSLLRCRIIARFGTGLDNIDRAAAHSVNIQVAGVTDYCTEEVANHTTALMLSWNRKILQSQEFVKKKRWNERSMTTGNWGVAPIGRLSRQTLGLLGFGRIGQAVAQRARAFGMTVLANTRHPERVTEPRGVIFTSREELLRRSDFVSLHLPLSDDTRNLINAKAIRMMKPGAALINTSRGGLVDEDALVAALDSGHLAGALLDVFKTAPLPPDHPLREIENVILTPHVAFYSEEALLDLRRLAAEAVRAHLT